ncbi:hypothetical protein ACIL2N_000959 [Vibrio metschnikovii]
MSSSIAAKANAAMMSGKKLSSYDLPKEVKRKLAERRYSQQEINDRFKAYQDSKVAC